MIWGATAHEQPSPLGAPISAGAPLYPEASMIMLNSYRRGIKVLAGNGKCLLGYCCSFSELCQDLQTGNAIFFCFWHIYCKGTVYTFDL